MNPIHEIAQKNFTLLLSFIKKAISQDQRSLLINAEKDYNRFKNSYKEYYQTNPPEVIEIEQLLKRTTRKEILTSTKWSGGTIEVGQTLNVGSRKYSVSSITKDTSITILLTDETHEYSIPLEDLEQVKSLEDLDSLFKKHKTPKKTKDIQPTFEQKLEVFFPKDLQGKQSAWEFLSSFDATKTLRVNNNGKTTNIRLDAMTFMNPQESGLELKSPWVRFKDHLNEKRAETGIEPKPNQPISEYAKSII